MEKQYVSKKSNFYMTINVKGERRMVFFEKSSIGGLFITRDTNVQSALESDERFKRVYDVITTQKPDKKKAKTDVKSVEVRNINQAKEYLIKNVGIPSEEINGEEDIENLAKRENILFQYI